MKRILYFLLTLVLIANICPVTHADMINTPLEDFLNNDTFNLFYLTHSDDCYHVSHTYTTLTRVTVYKSPESFLVKGHIPAQERITIILCYIDHRDIGWGFIDDGNLCGWIPMDYLQAVYTTDDFAWDYANQLQTPEEPLFLDPAYAGQKIWAWAYPGSESGTVNSYSDNSMPHFWYSYTDPEGRLWGQLPRRSSPWDLEWGLATEYCWICLDNPTANFAQLYPNGAPEVDPRAPHALPEQKILPSLSIVNVGISVGVLACVVLTSMTLVKMKKARNG